MRVKEIMNQKHPFIYEDELATKARAIIRDFALRILPVIDKTKRLIGIVSRGDVMTISSSVSPIRVKGIMRNPKHTATMEDDATSTVKEMIRLDEWNTPVINSVEERNYVGVFGLENFIEAIIKTSPEKLAKTVEEVMSKNVVACSPEDEVDNIWRLMQTKSLGGVPVTKNDRLVGIVTQKDLIQSGALLPTFESKKGRFRGSSKISSLMNTQVIAVEPSIKVIRVAKIMVSRDIGRVPVIDKEGKLIGIVDREDVAKLIVK
ncbi:MAG: CBS domain-containing protein [Candidatus Bathyarchaeota archaeon]|nr:CBS domain-containing protein [Candidatus Bathyarchaeota archaeon]MDI6805102.1 CBS domain-containing protein [Candidatus Bathyarchaeia archaeon]